MKYIKKGLLVIVTLLLVLILTYNVYNFVSINVLHKDLATVNGYAILEVVSGSMEPTIHVGDLIIIDTKERDFKERDIVTFYDKQGSFVTHRILSIEDDEMITKGDNNDTEDDTISTDKIVGKYIMKIDGGGKLLSAFKSPLTMIMILIIGILVCVLISTDEDGNPILDEDEKEFIEFQKSKNNSKKNEEKITETKKNTKSTKTKKNTKTKDNQTDKSETPKKVPTSTKKKVEGTKRTTKKSESQPEKKTTTKKSSSSAKVSAKKENTKEKKEVKKTKTSNSKTSSKSSSTAKKKTSTTKKKTDINKKTTKKK